MAMSLGLLSCHHKELHYGCCISSHLPETIIEIMIGNRIQKSYEEVTLLLSCNIKHVSYGLSDLAGMALNPAV